MKPSDKVKETSTNNNDIPPGTPTKFHWMISNELALQLNMRWYYSLGYGVNLVILSTVSLF